MFFIFFILVPLVPPSLRDRRRGMEAASVPTLLHSPLWHTPSSCTTSFTLHVFAPPLPHFPALSLGKFRGVGAITIFDEGEIDNGWRTDNNNIDSVLLVGKRHKVGVALAHAPF
ncbi:MAG: hypothetical protein BYD32DRAFT_422802 [Podila humilis]|nr:MAG: hypothetical protein BYD32DRAFT_422802 [Podila humilis]